MLKPEEILEAIKFFYKDFENLEVGNPQPFVKSYDTGLNPINSIDLFNELMHGGGTLKNIFYGRVTWSIWNSFAVSDVNIVCYNYPLPDMSATAIPLNVFQEMPATVSFQSGTSQGLFIQDVFMENNCTLSFDGYIFGLEEKI
jgi:hypothetical protein